jgi:hypothetical protein
MALEHLTASMRKGPARVQLTARLMCWSLVVFTALLGYACGESPRPAPAVPPPTTWDVGVVPVLSIGDAGEQPGTSLYRVTHAEVLPDSTVLLVNEGTSEIRIYDQSGLLLRTIGGAGGGPGEFRRLSGVLAAPQDTIYAFDSSAWQLTALTFGGDLLSTYPLPARAFEGGARPVYRLIGRLTSGAFVLAPSAFPGLRTGRPGSTYWTRAPHLLYMLTVDSLRAIGPSAGIEMISDGRAVTFRILGAATATAVDNGRFYFGDSGFRKISVYDSAGSLVQQIRLPQARRPVTRALADSALQWRLGHQPGSRHWKAAQQWYGVFPPPDSVPTFSSLAFDVDGNLWVQEYQNAGERRPLTWSVFNPDGDWIADVETPEGFKLYGAGRDYVIGKGTDTLGIESVRVYRLQRKNNSAAKADGRGTGGDVQRAQHRLQLL